MKIEVFLLPILITAFSNAEVPPIDSALAQRAFTEAKALSLRDGGNLWGRPLYGPMLIVDPDSRRVVANRADAHGLLQKEGGLYTGLLPKGIGIANTATNWSGVLWTMVVWPLPENGESRGRLMMHECFHRIQPELPSGAKGGNLPAEHLDSLDGRIWIQLEWRALEEALLSRGSQQTAAIRDAMIFRGRRQQQFPESAASELTLERVEGLAEYTGVIVHAYSLARAKADALDGLRNGARQATFGRSFAYASGPAYGLLLDERSPGWRRQLGPGSDLGDLLAKAVALRLPKDLSKDAHLRASRYGGERLRSDETRNESERAQRRSHLRARFIDGPVIQFPMAGHTTYTFNPSGAEPLEGFGTVFSRGTASGDWGNLEASEFLVLSSAGRNTGFQVPAPDDPTVRPLKGQGWSLALNPGWGLYSGVRKGDWVVSREPPSH
jgi:hypothetical protein